MAEGGDRKGWRDLEELVLWSKGLAGPLSRGVEGSRVGGGQGGTGAPEAGEMLRKAGRNLLRDLLYLWL